MITLQESKAQHTVSDIVKCLNEVTKITIPLRSSGAKSVTEVSFRCPG
ncbi:hypothetical protein Mic7113_1580 [Allocoleopsis franciscana PCC 7113]|uniref:Uncharacterized protein n=1 Tax=Allocoleopsis franciscana PCC 7113 TaxID=1173027 RepID=K9WCG5_9CYAN|nr:hypothetical protein Mic7113_1580 [Allocoleopsis franciscana PCC 7113]